MRKVLIIVGPTASGKSALAVMLAKKFHGEVISADSRQVYRGLNIGTGKVTKSEMGGVRHHLLDVASPKKAFSAGDFVKRGRIAIEDISRRGKLPVVAGGTGFYIDALVGRISLPEAKPDAALRKKLSKKSASVLFSMLKKVDSKRAQVLSSPSERHNKVRLIRALEIARALGKTPKTTSRAPYDVFWVGIKPKDGVLRDRIDMRLTWHLKKGMIAEASRLHRTGLTYKRMEELGLEYRSLARFLQKKITRAELENELQSDIWRYARKQLGYWKRNGKIVWFAPSERAAILRRTRTWLMKNF